MSDQLSLLREDIANHQSAKPPTLPSGMSLEQAILWESIRKKLLLHRIRSDTPLPNQKHLLEIHGIRSFPRGDLVAISGKEKCGKTTDCRILVSALLCGDYMGIKAIEEKLRILWIDTEQATITTRTVTRGIEMMCGFRPSEDQFLHYSMRGYPDHDELQTTLDVQFNDFCPDIVIIDGIRDYIDDFNDVVSSSQIVLKCMQLSSGVSAELSAQCGLAQRPPCCVITILHQNKPKDDNSMRGHLGTELSNKAGEVWEATRDDDHVFAFAQRCSRTRPVEQPILYKVHTSIYYDDEGNSEEIGIPEVWETMLTEEPQASVQEPKVETIVTKHGTFEKNHDTACWMFYTVMENKGWEYNELKRTFCSHFEVAIYDFNKLRAMLNGEVRKSTDGLWYYYGPNFYAEQNRQPLEEF